MRDITPEQVEAAIENVKDWLSRGQDAPYRLYLSSDGEDVVIKIDGWVSLSLIVVHALEGAAKATERKSASSY